MDWNKYTKTKTKKKARKRKTSSRIEPSFSDRLVGLNICLDQLDPCTVDHNWENITAAVIKDGLYGYFIYKIDEMKCTSLPAHLYQKLKKGTYNNRLKQVEWEGCWLKIINVLNKSGITPISLKGWVVDRLVYSVPGLRDMADIDFLVQFDDAEKVVNALVTLGYTPPMKWEDPAIRKYNLEQGVHIKLTKTRWPRLEVHIALAHEIAPRANSDFFKECLDGPVQGEKIPEMSHLLFHIFHHGARHRESIKWILDAWLILKQHQEPRKVLKSIADLALLWQSPLFIMQATLEFESVTKMDMKIVKEKLIPSLRIPEKLLLRSWRKRMKQNDNAAMQIAHRISLRPVTGYAGIWHSLLPPVGHTVEKYNISSTRPDFWKYRIRDIMRRFVTFRR